MQLDNAKQLLTDLRYDMLRKSAEAKLLEEDIAAQDPNNELEVSINAKKSFDFNIGAKILGVKINALEDHILTKERQLFEQTLVDA